MEHISHSLPKRSFFSNSNVAFTSHKSIYDDVFSGPPKFGLPTLAPRLEDYSEIFGGFHASRSSSIPLLHLPLIGYDFDLRSDVRSPAFDYSEVFGDFKGFHFTASFQDLVGESSGGYDSSDEQCALGYPLCHRSPAQSASLSDELDPLAGSDEDHKLSNGEVHQSLGSNSQFNVYHDKSSQRNLGTWLTGTSYVPNLQAVPGYTFFDRESAVSWHGEDKLCSMHIGNDINHNQEFGEGVIETKHNKKCLLSPTHSGSSVHGNDFNLLEKYGNSISPWDKPFMTVCDINLRTKPSQLPPPSRPPPALVNSKLRASFEGVVDNSAPFLFDVEEDDIIFAAGRANGNENVKMNHEVSKQSFERKDISSLRSVEVEEQTNNTISVSSSEDEKMPFTLKKQSTASASVIEDRMESTKSTEETSGSWGLHCCEHIADKFDGAVAWREETEYFEVIEKKIDRKVFHTVEGCDTFVQHMTQDNYMHQRTADCEEFNQKENSNEFIGQREAPGWIEGKNELDLSEEHCDWDSKQKKEKQNTMSSSQKGFQEKIRQSKLPSIYNSNNTAENFQLLGESENLQMKHGEIVEGRPKAKANVGEVESQFKPKTFPERMDIEKRFLDAQVTELNSGKHKQNIPSEEWHRRFEDVEGTETRERVKKKTEPEGTEKQHSGASEKKSKNRLKEAHKLKEEGTILKEARKRGEIAMNSYRDAEHEKGGYGKFSHKFERDNEGHMVAGRQNLIELPYNEAVEWARNDTAHKLVPERQVIVARSDVSQTEDNDLRSRMVEIRAGNKQENFETKGTFNLSTNAGILEDWIGLAEEIEPTERNGYDRELKQDLDGHASTEGDRLNVFDGGANLDETSASEVSMKHDIIQMLKLHEAAFLSKGHRVLKAEPNPIAYEAEDGVDDTIHKGKFNRVRFKKDALLDEYTHSALSDSVKSPCLPKPVAESSVYDCTGFSCVMQGGNSSILEHSHQAGKIISPEDDGGEKIEGTQGDVIGTFTRCQEFSEPLINGRKVEDAPSMLEQSENALCSIKTATKQGIERKDQNVKENLAAIDKEGCERIRRKTELENERMRKVEEEREREREREKDRMAVDKAALEAHARSYFEAHERAERAAVERATAEVRQRARAGARLEKSSVEARLKTEQAAIERATAETQPQTAGKSNTQKGGHNHVERSSADRFSASFRSADTRQSSLSSDLRFRSSGISNVSCYSYSSARIGAEGESPQRCKARLERYRRTAERAANALAEKNMLDTLAQREREERNRVAEVLDAEVKRWSSGKEGNLRALLSTLQYILGPDSGWQPVPLTEVITSAAVKRSYRKATLCVHPDKLQQRGATIQQKYICEKVFDLLKEAWNKFNSEER